MAVLEREAFAKAIVPLLPRGFEPQPVEEARARIGEALLGSDAVRALVVDGEGRLEGLVTYGRNRDDEPVRAAGEIRALFVAPRSWRSGLGRTLVERACTELAEMGYASVSLWSLRDNARANAFYEHLGFERDGATQVRATLGAPVRAGRSAELLTQDFHDQLRLVV